MLAFAAALVLSALMVLVGLSVIGALTQVVKALSALTDHAQALTDALKTHSGGLMVVASGDALVANRVAALTETLKGPLQVNMVPPPSAFETVPTKGTH